MVIDEAHKALAPTIRQLIEAAQRDDVAVLGLTATPGRGAESAVENRQLARVFGRDLVRPATLGADPIRELQRRGILARVDRVVIDSGVRLKDAGGRDAVEDVPDNVLKALARNEHRNQVIVDVIDEQVTAQKPTLVFCCSVDHARLLASRTALKGSRTAFLDCRMRRGCAGRSSVPLRLGS